MADVRRQVGVAEDGAMRETILGKYRRKQEREPRTELWGTGGGRSFCKVHYNKTLSRHKGEMGKWRGQKSKRKSTQESVQRGSRSAKNPSHSARQNLITAPSPPIPTTRTNRGTSHQRLRGSLRWWNIRRGCYQPEAVINKSLSWSFVWLTECQCACPIQF